MRLKRACISNVMIYTDAFPACPTGTLKSEMRIQSVAESDRPNWAARANRERMTVRPSDRKDCRQHMTETTTGKNEAPGSRVYLECELCGRAFSPRKVKSDRPARCPACTREERSITLDHCSPALIREKTLLRKTQESRDAVARRLKGT